MYRDILFYMEKCSCQKDARPKEVRFIDFSVLRVIFHAFSEGRIAIQLRFRARDALRESYRATARVFYKISDAPSLHAPRAGTRLTVYRAHQVLGGFSKNIFTKIKISRDPVYRFQ